MKINFKKEKESVLNTLFIKLEYMSGDAEATDVDYKETTLKYDAANEATVYVKDEDKKSKVEDTSKKDSDSLPF